MRIPGRGRAAAFLIALLAASGAAAQTAAGRYSATALQQTRYGAVQGVLAEDTGTLAWKGVPYAKPPVGRLRWKAPEDLDRWDGVLQAGQYGNRSVQLAGAGVAGDEDCLYLNIWRPNTPEENLPVLVFVHGGSNVSGSGEAWKGDNLARRTDSVIISLNYRLGVMGFFNHEALKSGDELADSGNFALLDIIKALAWVRDNIASFGGDPANVTLSGFSAGGRNSLAALTSPLARGLVHKAVSFSGGLTMATPEEGQAFADRVVRRLVISDGIACNEAEAQRWLDDQPRAAIAAYLRGKSAAAFAVAVGGVPIRMSSFAHLFRDGHVLPNEGFDVAKTGRYSMVPMIASGTAFEFVTFAMSDPYFGGAIAKGTIFQDEKKLRTYQDAVRYGGPLYSGFNIDSVARCFSQAKGQPPVYALRFSWGTLERTLSGEPVDKLIAAAHGSDIDFYTGYEEYSLAKTFPGKYYTAANKPGRADLADKLVGYLSNFLRSGDPNGPGLPRWGAWSEMDNAPRVLVVNADRQQSIIRMSPEYLKKEEILAAMGKACAKDELDVLRYNILAGRFFMDF